MCSFGLVGVSQAFSVSDFSSDWKSLPGAPVVGTELRTHEQGLVDELD